MLVKAIGEKQKSESRRVNAGNNAESQMEYILNRRYGDTNPNVYLLSDLRLVDPEQKKADGSPDVAQIDHLIIHRFGGFIIESKSVSDRISVQTSPQAGEQWYRGIGKRRRAMDSPISQAIRQAEFLRNALQFRKSIFFGQQPSGMRGFTKRLVEGNATSFLTMPIQIIVAISGQGQFDAPSKNWVPKAGRFCATVRRADQVDEYIDREMSRHAAGNSLLTKEDESYGKWRFPEGLPKQVAIFLSEHHSPRSFNNPSVASATPDSASVQPNKTRANVPTSVSAGSHSAPSTPPTTTVSSTQVCKHCNSANLTVKYGKFGYYFTCRDCSKSTSISLTCEACGAGGAKGQGVRIRKKGQAYFRDCEHCGISQRIRTASPADT